MVVSAVKFGCTKCGKAFIDNANLRRHLARKTPCQPIVNAEPTDTQPRCQHCGRSFASKTSMYRHARQYCKVARSRTGGTQGTPSPDQNEALRSEIVALRKRLDTLTASMSQTALDSSGPPGGPPISEK